MNNKRNPRSLTPKVAKHAKQRQLFKELQSAISTRHPSAIYLWFLHTLCSEATRLPYVSNILNNGRLPTEIVLTIPRAYRYSRISINVDQERLSALTDRDYKKQFEILDQFIYRLDHKKDIKVSIDFPLYDSINLPFPEVYTDKDFLQRCLQVDTAETRRNYIIRRLNEAVANRKVEIEWSKWAKKVRGILWNPPLDVKFRVVRKTAVVITYTDLRTNVKRCEEFPFTEEYLQSISSQQVNDLATLKSHKFW